MPQPWKVDRIFEDILHWIRSLLWYREGTIEHKPYARVQKKLSPYGTLWIVERKSNRAVRTYVFVPAKGNKKGTVSDDLDLHIYLDHLFPLPGQKTNAERNDRGFRLTHAIAILWASRTVDPKNGTYSLSLLFNKKYHLQKGPSHHQSAVLICDRLAIRLLQRHLITFLWEEEIREIGLKILGSTWMINEPPQSTTTAPHGVILDNPDGTRRTFNRDPKAVLNEWKAKQQEDKGKE